MPLYTDASGHQSFYFIHIPRTGGRFFHTLMELNNMSVKYADFNQTYLQREVPHLEYPLYNDLDGVLGVKKFAIVRNPIDKFKSSIKGFLDHYHLKIDFFDRNLTEENLNTFVNHQVKTCKNPFMLEQHKFMDNNTLIWKFENGFGYDFIEWFNLNFDLNIEMKQDINYHKFPFDDITPKISDTVVSFVKKYYEKDYQLFDY